MSFAKPDGRIVALIKPQFEAERHEVGKKGVVRDAAVHARVCAEARDWLPSRSEEHTSEIQSLMRLSYAAFCLNTKTISTMTNNVTDNVCTSLYYEHTHDRHSI